MFLSLGRGVQLNTGAKHSTGSNLIFVHADTTLPRAFDSHVMVTLTEPGVVCGAFEFALDVLEKNQEAEDKEEETAGKGKTRFSTIIYYFCSNNLVISLSS